MRNQSFISLLLLPISLFLSTVPCILGQGGYEFKYLWHNCGNNFTQGSSLGQGLNQLVQTLNQTINRNASADYAAASNESLSAYAILQCRRDLPAPGDCARCLTMASAELLLRCPFQVDAMIWFDGCFLRYDNQSFSSKLDKQFYYDYWNPTISNSSAFVEKSKELIPALACEAESSGRGFSMGSTNYSSSNKIYGLVQCNQDLTMDDCSKCLTAAVNRILGPCQQPMELDCDKKIGRRILMENCYVQYEQNIFYGNTSQGLIELPSNSKCNISLSPSSSPPPPASFSPPPPASFSPSLSQALPLIIYVALFLHAFLG